MHQKPISMDRDRLEATRQMRAWQAGQLELAGKLHPMELVVDVHAECVRETKGENGPRYDVRPAMIPIRPSSDDVLCFAHGIRVFNAPREVIIEQVRLGSADRPIYSTAFDAAAFALETPMPPLRVDDEPYQGEPMRFVAQDLGCFSTQHPLWLTVRPWQAIPGGVPSLGFPPLDALLFVLEAHNMPHSPP